MTEIAFFSAALPSLLVWWRIADQLTDDLFVRVFL